MATWQPGNNGNNGNLATWQQWQQWQPGNLATWQQWQPGNNGTGLNNPLPKNPMFQNPNDRSVVRWQVDKHLVRFSILI